MPAVTQSDRCVPDVPAILGQAGSYTVRRAEKKPQPSQVAVFFFSCSDQWENSELPTLPAIFSGLIRKRASAGSSHKAPNMFHNNMNVSIRPMSA